MINFLGMEKMLSLFSRKAINKLSKTNVRFHIYLFVEKCLNACFLMLCFLFLKE